MRRIDPQRLKILDRRRPEQIASHSRDHKNFGAAQSCRDRLVRAFAAKPKIKFLSEDGLARLGKVVGKSREVDVRASDHNNAGTLRHKGLCATPIYAIRA